MGKTVTSYPPTCGENSLESFKGAELPHRFTFGLRPGKMKPGRGQEGQEEQAATSSRGSGRWSCSYAHSVPKGTWHSTVFPLVKSACLQASRPLFAVMTRCKLGRGAGTGWLQAQLCQEFRYLG